jgi:glycosyltransferase involved in cell wall biosynthesis
MTEVSIVQRRMTHYRIPLFERMNEMLSGRGIRLRLLHGQPTCRELEKNDSGRLDWAEPLENRYLLGDRICWQNFHGATRSSDLVIATQENKLIYNLVALTALRPKRFAFWGHGRNMQSPDADRWSERFKRWTTRQVDWWFAYTELSKSFVVQAGFDAGRVTVVDNAVDTESMARDIRAVDAASLATLRERLGIGEEAKVGLFLGSLYGEKRLDFLLAAGDRLADLVPGFVLVVVGEGPDRELVEAALDRSPWLRYVGSQHGQAKAAFLALADVFLNPGLVGLGILDSFVAQSPIITTDCGLHSPEIAYLEHDVNGLMTANDLQAFVDAVSNVLKDPQHLERLKSGCKASASRYTIDNMASRFVAGIEQALVN